MQKFYVLPWMQVIKTRQMDGKYISTPLQIKTTNLKHLDNLVIWWPNESLYRVSKSLQIYYMYIYIYIDKN